MKKYSMSKLPIPLPQLAKLKKAESGKKKKTVSFAGDFVPQTLNKNDNDAANKSRVNSVMKAMSRTSPMNHAPSPDDFESSSNDSNEEVTTEVSLDEFARPASPPTRKADQEYLEYNLFTGPHSTATETLAILKWQKYLRTKQEIRVDLTKILAKCQTYFGNVGVGFNYNIGDDNFVRRELGESWRERRKTGVICADTEQDQFVIDQEVAIVDTAPDSQAMDEVSRDAKKIAHRGNMNMMISEYKRRMVKRVTGLEELEKWIVTLSENVEEESLEELEEFIDNSYEEFTKGRYEAKAMVKQMRRLLRKMGEKHRMLQNRMKVTSKLKERAAMANKNLKIDYTSVQTINQSFEQIINRQLVLMSATKKMSRESGENDEKLRKIQQHMMRCVKELSDDKEALFHKNHMLSVESQKLKDRCKIAEEQLEFYENKVGLEKHQATTEAGKTVDILTQEIEQLMSANETMVQEGEALKNEVVELHDQVLVHEVTNGDLRKEIVDLKERHENMEFMMNEEKSKFMTVEEECTVLQEENLALRVANSTKPEVAHKTVSIQSLESIPTSVSTVSDKTTPQQSAEVVYVDRVVENYDAGTDTDDLIVEMGLTAEMGMTTDAVEFAEDKKRGLTNPFETDLLAGNMNFLQNVKLTKERKSQQDHSDGNSYVAEKRRVLDTPGYTQMIVNRLKEERQNDTKRMSDYIHRERVRTEATTTKLKHENKRVLKRLKMDMRAMLLAILRHRNKIVELFHKGGIELEGLINPTIAEIKGDKSDKTSVSLKHTAVEVINSLDYNLCMGLKEMHFKIKETVENQKKTEKKLVVKNKKLEKNSKAVETLESRMLALKRDTERLKYREHFTNERYRELLKREEDLERAEEAHVDRIEQRLSDMWTKSTTEIKDGLDEILQIRQPEAMADKRLRRVSRPHRPKDRMTKTIEVDAMETVDEKASLSMSVLETVVSEEESSDEEYEEDDEGLPELNLQLKIDTTQQQQQSNLQTGAVVNNANETEAGDVISDKGQIHKGSNNHIPKSESEWTERKAEELKKYIEDFETVKPSTINHGEDHKFLHFDSCVAKIDDMYKTILQGDPANDRRKRRNAGVGAVANTIELYSGPHQSRQRQEMQLTIMAMDQVWNVSVLRTAYESKQIGIRVYSNALDLIRRNLALKEARFKLLTKRMCRVNHLIATQSLLQENEDKNVEQEVVDVVMDRLPEFHARRTARYVEKVHKLVKLNTYILAEQVRVFQQIRDCDLSMTLRFPYPIVHAEEENRFQCEAEPRLDNIKRKKMQNSTHFSSRRSLVKMQFPSSMEAVLTTKTFATNTSDGHKLWRNPALDGIPVESKAEPMSYALVLDCNALRPHQDVSLPMAKLNPHKIIPSINPKTLDATSSKPSSASFTLPPVVENYSSVDSGIGSSNCILDPAKYM